MDLNYKGAYNAGTNYTVGDVVKFTDDVWYVRQPADSGKAGYPCNDSKRWGRADVTIATAAEMTMEATSKIKYNIVEKTIEISGTGDIEDVLIPSGETRVFDAVATDLPAMLLGGRAYSFSGLDATKLASFVVMAAYFDDSRPRVNIEIKNQSDDDIALSLATYKIGLKLYGFYI